MANGTKCCERCRRNGASTLQYYNTIESMKSKPNIFFDRQSFCIHTHTHTIQSVSHKWNCGKRINISTNIWMISKYASFLKLKHPIAIDLLLCKQKAHSLRFFNCHRTSIFQSFTLIWINVQMVWLRCDSIKGISSLSTLWCCLRQFII